MSRAYYNELEPGAAAWLRELIKAGHLPQGDVDERSIVDVQAGDLAGYGACHFFAGIGGWPYALQLAGWPDDREVWTGSCPCQPFSPAGRGEGADDARHLWPAFHKLIEKRRPATVFGEQVAGKAGRAWLAGVRADLEDLGYAVGAADLCAAGVGAPHIRQRLWWVSHTYAPGRAHGGGGKGPQAQKRPVPFGIDTTFRDTWARPVPKADDSWLVDGLSADVGAVCGYGNAIVPQVAAEFIAAYLETECMNA